MYDIDSFWIGFDENNLLDVPGSTNLQSGDTVEVYLGTEAVVLFGTYHYYYHFKLSNTDTKITGYENIIYRWITNFDCAYLFPLYVGPIWESGIV